MPTRLLMHQTIKWISRTLAVVYVIFISLFALDVFSGQYNIGQTIMALIIHLLPAFVVIAVSILAWRQESAGGMAFIILAILFTIYFRTYRRMDYFLIITVPLLIIGGLFLIGRGEPKINKNS